MAYMDIPPSAEPNGKTVVLFHGKASGCYYFRNVIEALTGAGYRVVAPDQIGWGKSSKPDIHYSFQLPTPRRCSTTSASARWRCSAIRPAA
jgi:pimeloyl-ACP methyl ester carboxylesterase